MSEDNDLPANAAVRLAVMTGRPIEEFEPDAAIPGFSEQEERHD